MQKIIIIGSSGAGKTTLAKSLSSILDIPHIELDSLYHQANWQPVDKDTLRKKVNEITDSSGWIFCGNYFSTLGTDFWRKADVVIWCDYSLSLVMSRLVRRTLFRSLKKEHLWNGNREEFFRNFFTKHSIILWMLRTRKKQKQRYQALFSSPEKFPHTHLVRLTCQKSADDYLETLATYKK